LLIIGRVSTLFEPLKKIIYDPFLVESGGTSDAHALFRGHFRLDEKTTVVIRHTGASVYRLWVDGEILDEGPARFDLLRPELLTISIDLPAGGHVIAAHVHAHGETTRLLSREVPPFLHVSIQSGAGETSRIKWVGLATAAYYKTGRRLGCVLGPVEWCDTRFLPVNWTAPDFDENGWSDVMPVALAPNTVALADLSVIAIRPRPITKVDSGELVNMSPVMHDPPMNFITRELSSAELPADGIWSRYDLSRVQLGRPRLTIQAPAGALVQCAYAECLTHGRVSPYLKSGSGDNSCMMDAWVASGGRQCLEPLQPKGARYLEVHIVGADPSELKIESVEWNERSYYLDEPEGSFTCDDELLNRIWRVGVDTLRSCAEDAVTDNPHRERGQWLGDAVGAGMDILAVSYADWRPLERGLLQAAQCVREDGQIPAVFPGTREYLPSFAIQWVSAVPHYYRLGGDKELLRNLYQIAVRNLESFNEARDPLGLRTNPKHWNFIDWGYRGSATVFCDGKADTPGFDPALSLIYLKALRSLADWARWIGEDSSQWARDAEGIAVRFGEHLKELAAQNASCWEVFGYHATALALGQGVVPASEIEAAVAFLKQHILSCFPNDNAAPRLSGPTVESDRLITPFFFHHVLPVLIEHGEMPFVLDQLRVCWGWSLDLGMTTWPEVFDPRWSHCHQWSGCPTWILSRYVLGLHARFDLGGDCFELKLHPGELTSASGFFPLRASTDRVEVSWKRVGAKKIAYSLRAPRPIRLLMPDGRIIDTGGEWRCDLTLPTSAPAHPLPATSNSSSHS